MPKSGVPGTMNRTQHRIVSTNQHAGKSMDAKKGVDAARVGRRGADKSGYKPVKIKIKIKNTSNIPRPVAGSQPAEQLKPYGMAPPPRETLFEPTVTSKNAASFLSVGETGSRGDKETGETGRRETGDREKSTGE